MMTSVAVVGFVTLNPIQWGMGKSHTRLATSKVTLAESRR